jgi:hypothetical protein
LTPGSRKSSKKEDEVTELIGTDWESVNYSLETLACAGDEITGWFDISLKNTGWHIK